MSIAKVQISFNIVCNKMLKYGKRLHFNILTKAHLYDFTVFHGYMKKMKKMKNEENMQCSSTRLFSSFLI